MTKTDYEDASEGSVDLVYTHDYAVAKLIDKDGKITHVLPIRIVYGSVEIFQEQGKLKEYLNSKGVGGNISVEQLAIRYIESLEKAIRSKIIKEAEQEMNK